MIAEVTAHRRFLHQIPELNDDLPQTMALVEGVLRGHRCDYFSPIPGSVCVRFDFGRPETVAFRAELDALPLQENTGLPYTSRNPGKVHARGNDGHTAMLLSLAQWLSEFPTAPAPSSALSGVVPPRNVLLLFQPGKESGTGAGFLCRSGILEQNQVTRIFGLRLWPRLPAGTIASRPGALLARSDKIDVRVEGKSVHVFRADEGRDALQAGIAFLKRAQDMESSAPPPCVLRFGLMRSGTFRDTISGETKLEGTLRTYSEQTRQYCQDALIRISRDVTQEYGCPVSIHLSGGCAAVHNDTALWNSVLNGLEPNTITELDSPVLESEDFSFYQQRVPGILFFLGIGDTPDLHSPNFNFDDETILPKGLDFLKQLVMLK